MNTINKLILLFFVVFVFIQKGYTQNADPGIGIIMGPGSLQKGSTGILTANVGNYANSAIVSNSLRVTISIGSDAEILGIASGSDTRWSQLNLTTGSANTIKLTNTGGGFNPFDLGNILLTVRGNVVSSPDVILGNIVYISASNSLLCGGCISPPLNASQGNASTSNDNSQTSLTVTCFQDPKPVKVNCWDNFVYNISTCSWTNTGTQAVQPAKVNCWDNFVFNTTSCAWINSGTQPIQPAKVNCWDNFVFNTTTCAWINSGTQPVQPAKVNCWDNFVFNTSTCAWKNTGTQPVQPTLGTVTQPNCTTATGSFTITNYNAAFAYVVTPSTGVSVSVNTVTAPAGSYTVTATSGACTSILSASVTVNAQPAKPAAPTVSVTQPTCITPTGTITITAPTGTGLTYSINNVTYQSGISFAGIPSGSCIVTVKNAAGCVSTATLAVINATPTICNVAGIFNSTKTCTDYRNNAGTQLLSQLCYTTTASTISTVNPLQFFYITSVIAPSANFTINIVQTKSSGSLALFAIQNNNQINLYNNSCTLVATGVQVSLGLGRVCVTNAIAGNQYVLSVAYDTKSVIGAPFSGTAPTVLYSFQSNISGITLAGSSTSINMVPNCSSAARAPVALGATKVEIVKTLKATAYPNPFIGKFSLNIKSPESGMATIQFFNIYGSMIYEMKHFVQSGMDNVVEIKEATKFKSNVIYKINLEGYHTSGMLVKPN